MLGRERFVLASLLCLVALVSWAWIVVMALDMSGAMDGTAAWMATGTWDAPHLFLLWAMWAVMMAAMMLPSAFPIMLLYSRAALAHRDDSRAVKQAYGVAAGYLLVWAGFSVAATILQRELAAALFLSPMMEPAAPTLAAVLLLVAGGYQMTPLKHACLRSCRSPLSFLIRRWEPGWKGALRMGMHHGLYCLGCCWALMLLLFAGGVMNLSVIAALTAWVMIEKLVPLGELGSYLSGSLLSLTGIWVLVAVN
jgi:predicted metal-binding membrane protein